jgi:ADP-heptose:LPS heptosyltransferase
MTSVVSYFKSGIGNLVMATPALQAMASLDPSGKLDICLDAGWRDSRSRAVRDILTACPFVREIVTYPAAAKSHRYRRGLVPVQSETSDAGHWVRGLSKLPYWPRENWPTTREHEIRVNMRLARGLGYKGPDPAPYVPVADGPVLDLPRPVIGLCNGAFAAQMWAKKRWPYFPELARVLKPYFGGSLVGVGGAGEMAGVKLAADYCGKLGILESAKVVSQLDLFITTDTGCMHIADALGVPLLALFGSTLTTKNAPMGPRSRIIQAALKCAPCQYTDRFHLCREYHCMKAIGPPDVMREARHFTRELARAGDAPDAARAAA